MSAKQTINKVFDTHRESGKQPMIILTSDSEIMGCSECKDLLTNHRSWAPFNQSGGVKIYSRGLEFLPRLDLARISKDSQVKGREGSEF